MKVNKFKVGFEGLFSPRTVVPFLLGTVAVAVLGNAVYQLFTNWLGSTSSAIFRIASGAVLIVVLSSLVFSRHIGRWEPYPPLVGKKPPEKNRGLILLVSKPETCLKALEWHQAKLERCWLICSTQSASLAETLKTKLAANEKLAELIVVNDIYDPLEFRGKIAGIYSALPKGWSQEDVTFDFTGMTALASVGGILACLNQRRPIEYVPAKYNKELDAVQPLDPVEVTLSWDSGPDASRTGSLTPRRRIRARR